MRRPLCLFCAGALGVELVCAFLPQAWLLPLLAAIFVCGLLAAVRGRKPLKLGGILLLAGAVLGLGAVLRTHARLNALQAAYDGISVTLTAEVEQVRTSFYPGVVDAVLRVETVDGEAANFRVECAALPRCSAGERVRGTFALEARPEGEQRSAYADGIALNAELAGGTKLERLGESRSFRARTARLQSRLSAALRRGMAEGPAGVLAAMVTGDRTHLSTCLRKAYRGAGLSHVLVVSGMHVSILCGSVLVRFRLKRRKLRSYASCRRNALLRAGMAVLLVGVTGFTPSVLRAGAAVWISALGVWVYGPADALTSLGVAGVLMTAGNSYAVCDIGFELSYAAVLGTLAGAALARRSAERREEKRRRNKKTAGKRGGVLANCLRQQGAAVWETLCVSGCACMATFPVLVLRGLSTSLYALVSSVAVLWLVEPILLLGLAAALTGLAPVLEPLHRVTAFGAEVLVDLLDRWALWVSGWPGAQIYFDTAYAALVCLLLAALLGLAWHWNIRLRRRCPLCCSQRRLPSGPEMPSAGTWSVWNWWAVKWLRRSSSRRTTGPSCSTGAGRPPGGPWRRRWNAGASGRWKRSSTCGWTRRSLALSVQSRPSGQPGWPRIRPKRSGPTRRRWKSCAHRPAVQCGSPSRGSRL